MDVSAYVDLYWLPLGAGGHFVRFNGRVYEAVAARIQHRGRDDLYHSALEVAVAGNRYVIEMAPVWNERSKERGTVNEGAVGNSLLGRLRMFRYEIRCWREGRIPDADEAVDSPRRLTTDPASAAAILDTVAEVPTPVWGRDELRTGEMWNSNSVISWLLARNRFDVEEIVPPAGGRAPGWSAGLAVAGRSH